MFYSFFFFHLLCIKVKVVAINEPFMKVLDLPFQLHFV